MDPGASVAHGHDARGDLAVQGHCVHRCVQIRACHPAPVQQAGGVAPTLSPITYLLPVTHGISLLQDSML